jgi:hypothetical protein
MVDVHDQLNATQRARITGLCAIRDHARALLDAQLADEGDGRLGHLRAMLNGTYDRCVAKYGCLSTRANALAFRRDPDYPLLLSLEHYDEESETARKAALFSRRTLTRVVEPSTAGEPAEALAASVQWRGRVDPAYMAGLLAAPEAAVLAALAEAGHIFLDPADGHWKTADDYLSGNVKAKLKQAVLSGRSLPAQHRRAGTGAARRPATGGHRAASGRGVDSGPRRRGVHPAGPGTQGLPGGYSAEAGAWSVKYGEWEARQNVKVTQEFGTSRMNAIELVQCALNVQVPTVRDRDPLTDKYFVNPDETLAAREKLGLIKERFAGWAFEDTERREKLCRIYNDLFNATRPSALRWLAPEAAGVLPLLRAASAPVGFGVAHRAVRQHRAVPRGRCRQDGGMRHRRHGVAPAGFRQQALPCGPQPHAGPVHGGIRPALPERVGADGEQGRPGRRPPARAGVAHRHGRLGRGGHHALELRAHQDVAAIQRAIHQGDHP